MADSSRDAKVNIVGKDKTAAAAKAAARHIAQVRQQIKAIKTQAAAAQKEVDGLTSKIGKFAGTALAAGRRAAGMAGAVAGVGAAVSAVIVPLTHGTIALAAAAVKTTTSLLPLVGTLPALAAGYALAKVAALAILPALAEGVKPVVDAWEGVSARVGDLAQKGLPALARAWVKVGLPVVERDLSRISVATNRVVTGYGRWAVSADGVATLSVATGSAATAVERLVPTATAAAIAISRLAARAAPKTFAMLADVTERIGAAVTRWADSLSAGDIAGALDKVVSAVGRAISWLSALRNAVEWIGANVDKVKGMSDALAVLSLTLGAVSGNPAAIAGGTLALIVNHYDDIKSAASGMYNRVREIWQQISDDPNVKAVMATLRDIKSGIGGDLSTVWNTMKTAFDIAKEAAKSLWAEIGPTVVAWLRDPNTQTGIRAIAIAFALLAAAVIGITVAFAAMGAGIVATFAALIAYLVGTAVRVIGNVMTQIAQWMNVVLAAAAAAADALGMEGLADKLRGAISQINGFVAAANAAMAQLHDKTVTIRVITQGATLDDFRSAGAMEVKQFSGWRGGFAAATPGGRTQPATPIVNASTTVVIDGRELRAMARTEVRHEQGRQAWRATSGRR